jgi:hypothetical protein
VLCVSTCAYRCCVVGKDGKAAGKGEINSSIDALSTLSGVVMPLFWARFYSFAARHGHFGAPFLVAGLLMIGARAVLPYCVHPAKLYVSDYQFPADVLRPINAQRIRDRLRAHSVVVSKFQKGSPGEHFTPCACMQ